MKWVFVLVLTAHPMAVVDTQTLSTVFEEGVTLLEVRRDYRAAARVFERVANEADPPLAARALLHLGTCYERLKDDRSASTYQRILAKYPDQAEVAAEARARLTSIAPVSPSHRLSRPQWQRNRPLGIIGRPSADGRFIPTVGPSGISVLNADTGVTARPPIELPGNPGGRRLCEPGAVPPALSPDASALVLVCDRRGSVELQLIEVEGATPPRTLLRLAPGETALVMEWTRPAFVLVQITTAAHQNRLVTIGTSDGATKLITELSSAADAASLSADGRFILFDGPVSGTGRDRAIWVAAVGGGERRSATTAPLNDRFPSWTPDGSGVIFVSERTGAPGIWLQPFTKGLPSGPPRQLTPNVGAIVASLGLTRGGRLVYWADTGFEDAYVMSLGAGENPAGAATSLSSRSVGQNKMPTWSPDGTRVAFISRDRGIVIREPGTGNEAFVGSGLVSPTQPRFSPDGHSILVRAWNAERQHGIFSIDTRTSVVRALAIVSPENESRISPARWSRDGRSIVFVRSGQLLRVHIETGDEQVLHTFAPDTQVLTPDVSWVDDSIVFIEVRAGLFSLVRRDPSGALHRLREGVSGEQMRTPAWLPGNTGVILGRVLRDPQGASITSGLWRFDLSTGAFGLITSEGGNPRDPAVSPDGRSLAFSAGSASREFFVLENFLPDPKPTRPRR